MTMQGLNITKNSENFMGEIYRCCDNPQITYLAPVNINIDERTIGSVDVWRCAFCKKKFCEEKQLGIDSITDIVLSLIHI